MKRQGQAKTTETNTYTITRVAKSILPGKWIVYHMKGGEEWSVTMRPSLRGAAPGKRMEIQTDSETGLIISARLVS